MNGLRVPGGRMMRSDSARSGPLSGIVVTDLSRALAGPHATMMLGDLGATIIKVEAPAGDDTRGWGPPFLDPPDAERESTYFLSANRNKRSIVLDLKTDDDRDLLIRLISKSDVLVENFRTGVLDRLGFNETRMRDMNPRLIVLSITGFGHDGPDGGRSGYDQIAQGEAGLMSLTGPNPSDPQRVGVPIADLLAGMYGAYGVLAALHDRNISGVGQIVRTSLLAAVVGVHGFQGTRWTVAEEVGTAQGNHHPSIAPYGLFECADGAVQISVGSEKLWHAFCRGFGLDPLRSGMSTNPERVANSAALVALINELFASWNMDDLLVRMKEMGIPAGRVRSIDDVYRWAQTKSQGLLIDVMHESLGPLTLPGPPLRFFEFGGEEITRVDHEPPPVLDADSNDIRDWLSTT
jgi:formyl-CoA transferase